MLRIAAELRLNIDVICWLLLTCLGAVGVSKSELETSNEVDLKLAIVRKVDLSKMSRAYELSSSNIFNDTRLVQLLYRTLTGEWWLQSIKVDKKENQLQLMLIKIDPTRMMKMDLDGHPRSLHGHSLPAEGMLRYRFLPEGKSEWREVDKPVPVITKNDKRSVLAFFREMDLSSMERNKKSDN